MKAKKWLVIITGVLSAVSLVCAYLFCNYYVDEFTKNFAFAVLGSALLGMIMSFTEYLVVRKESLLNYYILARECIRTIASAHYVFAREPVKMLQAYISEETENRYREATGEAKEYKARNNLFSHMNEVWRQTVDIPEPEYGEWSKDQFDEIITRYKEDLCKAMDSYIKIAKMDLKSLENAYGELDFFFANRTLRKWIYNTIHCRIREYKNDVVRKAYHFRMYLSGETDNLGALIEMIDELQNRYFSDEKEADGNYSVITIMRKCVDDLEDSTERLRCKIYKQKYVEGEHTPYLEYHMLEKLNSPYLSVKKKTDKSDG